MGFHNEAIPLSFRHLLVGLVQNASYTAHFISQWKKWLDNVIITACELDRYLPWPPNPLRPQNHMAILSHFSPTRGNHSYHNYWELLDATLWPDHVWACTGDPDAWQCGRGGQPLAGPSADLPQRRVFVITWHVLSDELANIPTYVYVRWLNLGHPT